MNKYLFYSSTPSTINVVIEFAFNEALNPFPLVERGSSSAQCSPLLIDPLVLITLTLLQTLENADKSKSVLLSLPSVLVATITSFFPLLSCAATAPL